MAIRSHFDQVHSSRRGFDLLAIPLQSLEVGLDCSRNLDLEGSSIIANSIRRELADQALTIQRDFLKASKLVSSQIDQWKVQEVAARTEDQMPEVSSHSEDSDFAKASQRGSTMLAGSPYRLRTGWATSDQPIGRIDFLD